jgi:hypothetical protein
LNFIQLPPLAAACAAAASCMIATPALLLFAHTQALFE